MYQSEKCALGILNFIKYLIVIVLRMIFFIYFVWFIVKMQLERLSFVNKKQAIQLFFGKNIENGYCK